MAATGVSKPSDLKREHIQRRVAIGDVRTYREIYKEVAVGSMLN